MVITGPLESNKTELSLQINAFDKPAEYNEVKAWSQLMLNLIFLRPGTYPSMPEMGVGIDEYQYDFLESAVEELSSKITSQAQMYLPDVPLSGVQIAKVEHNGYPILFIKLFFNVGVDVRSSVIAINAEPRKFLDFEISW